MSISALALLFAGTVPAPDTTLDLFPADDVWAYPHASSPESDPFLRVWGNESGSVARSAGESDAYGYSFLRFDLAGLPEGKSVKKAVLVLFHTPKPTFSLELAKRAPLEARAMPDGIREKNWSYNDLEKFMPVRDKAGLYGAASPDKLDENKEFAISIDLTGAESPFTKNFEAARKGGSFSIALTSAMNPAEEETRATYKLCSKDGPKELRPVLKITFAD
ncbi:MAG TPA: hypothetical protein PLX06_08920 [Fimbriimonadaceae bacterium]|nr:hypothetical protein [Fimbriimonadaceae bacterium]